MAAAAAAVEGVGIRGRKREVGLTVGDSGTTLLAIERCIEGGVGDAVE